MLEGTTVISVHSHLHLVDLVFVLHSCPKERQECLGRLGSTNAREDDPKKSPSHPNQASQSSQQGHLVHNEV